MAIRNIQNPGLAQGFSVLADALSGGGVNAMIEADLNRGRRDLLSAQTGTERQQLADLQRYAGAQSSFADLFADPAILETPEGRAAVMAAGARLKDFDKAPGFAFGADSYIAPERMTDTEFSRAGVGTGVINSWQNTPAGYEDSLANVLAQQELRNQGLIEQQAMIEAGKLATAGTTGGSRSLATVSPATAAKINDMLEGALVQEFGGADIDPMLMDQIGVRATQIFQTTKNAPLAVQQAVGEFALQTQGERPGGPFSAFFPWDWGGDPGQIVMGEGVDPSTMGDVLAPPAAPAPALPGVSAQPTLAETAAAPMDDIGVGANYPALAGFRSGTDYGAEGPQSYAEQNGLAPDATAEVGVETNIPLAVDANGQLYAVMGNQKVPVQEGQVATSPSTGKRIIIKGGKWVPLEGA